MPASPNPLATADVVTDIAYEVPLDFSATVSGVRLGVGDPTSAKQGRAYIKAMHTPEGPTTVALFSSGPGEARAAAWGPGAASGARCAADWLGLSDNLEAFDPSPSPVVTRLAKEAGAQRIGRFGPLTERLVLVVLGQLVIAAEAHRSYNRLVRRYGEPAPGPFGLLMAPHPAWLAELPMASFHEVGVEQKRARIVKRVAADADRLDPLVNEPPAEAYRRLATIPGVGPWTISNVGREVFGDPDAVIVGDYNLPHTVAYALTGKRRSNDEEMLELLAPFVGHRGRAQTLLKRAGGRPPRHGPKLAFRNIERH